MNAREDIAAHFTSDTLANQLLGAYRAEVLREAADRLALELAASNPSLPGHLMAVRGAVRALRHMSDEAATQ